MKALWIKIKSWFARTLFKKSYTLLSFEPVFHERNQVIHPIVVEGPKKLRYQITIRASNQLTREQLIGLAMNHFAGKLEIPKP